MADLDIKIKPNSSLSNIMQRIELEELDRQKAEESLFWLKAIVAASDSEMPLVDLRDVVETFAEDFEGPEYAAFVQNLEESNDSHSSFCPDCGRKLVAWIRGQGEFPANDTITDCGKLGYGNELESWREDIAEGTLSPDDINLAVYRESIEADGPEHCAVCGRLLFTSPLETFSESEVDHFEAVLERYQDGSLPFQMTPGEWFAVHEMIRGIDFVEEHWFPLSSSRSHEVVRNVNTYARVLMTVRGLVNLAQRAAARQ